MPFGMIGRFAGDRLKDLGAAYKGFDSQLGGVLPGGVEMDGTNLVGEIARDALPGDRKVSGAAVAKKANSASENVARGNYSQASAGLHGGKAGAQLREETVETTRDLIAKKLITKAGTKPLRTAAGVVAPPLMIADRANDVKDAYSTFLDVRTGKDLDAHMADAAGKRDPFYGITAEPTYVGPSDGSIPTLEQRDPVNPFMQELNNRVNLATSNFNPLDGEWGITEALYGK